MKKRQWTVRRQTVECPDTQRRWDRSYQYLVQWSAMVDEDLPSGPVSQENINENRHLRGAHRIFAQTALLPMKLDVVEAKAVAMDYLVLDMYF
jgi:hypothetical protein